MQTDKLTFDGHNPPNVLADLFATDTTAVNVAAIKAKTDNLPASPAAVGSAMTLTSAALDAINYRGYLTFEYFNPFPHWPEAIVYHTSDALDRMLGRKA